MNIRAEIRRRSWSIILVILFIMVLVSCVAIDSSDSDRILYSGSWLRLNNGKSLMIRAIGMEMGKGAVPLEFYLVPVDEKLPVLRFRLEKLPDITREKLKAIIEGRKK